MFYLICNYITIKNFKRMFNETFYPTPREVGIRMLSEFRNDLKDKVVLEPSAGKGDLIDLLFEYGVKDIVCCELNKDLALISSTKGRLLAYDFFDITKDVISHVDFIVMNPPFHNAEKHILYAYDIMPEGCELVALCNTETIRNTHINRRALLKGIINDFGYYTELGDVFKDSERSTNVDVSLIYLYKPKTSTDETEFDGFLLDDESELHNVGIVSYNSLRAIVSEYIYCCNEYKDISLKCINLNKFISKFTHSLEFKSYDRHDIMDYDRFKKELQKNAWKRILGELKMDKYVTKQLMEELNKFVEQQINVPFTMKNVYRMLDIIVGTNAQRMDKVVMQVFDRVTKHYYDNRFNVEGWKTNSNYCLNKKFILDRLITTGFNGKVNLSVYHYTDNSLDELVKALCWLTGTLYENCVMDTNVDEVGRKSEIFVKGSLWATLNHKKVDFGEWFDFWFFRVKAFKKGTLHCEFKDEKIWLLFNKKVASILGEVLPEFINKK